MQIFCIPYKKCGKDLWYAPYISMESRAYFRQKCPKFGLFSLRQAIYPLLGKVSQIA